MTQSLAVDADTVVDRYLAALNEPDAGRRRQLIETAWAPDGGMTDPPLVGQGHDGVEQLGDALHSQFAGHAFFRTSVVDSHHGWLRFSWVLTGPDGVAALTGMDIAAVSPDGRVGQVVGFFGELAARQD